MQAMATVNLISKEETRGNFIERMSETQSWAHCQFLRQRSNMTMLHGRKLLLRNVALLLIWI